jgi:flagellar basal body-associated protein FliL
VENQPKNTTKDRLILLIIIIALFLVFIGGLVLWRKWAISKSIEVTVEITDKWATADEYSNSGWQYAVVYYNSSESTETIEKFFDTETSIQGMSVGTFISDVDYKIGDKVDGYLRKSVSEYYFMPK